MISKFVFFLFFPMLFFSWESTAQIKNNISLGIEQKTLAENVQFNAWCRNETEDTIKNLSYQFYGWKKSASGTSNISQTGKFELKAEKKISLSSIKLNNIQEGMINLKLEIFHGDSIIGVDSLKINP